MKFSFFIFFFLFNLTPVKAKQWNIDSLRHEVELARNDTLLLINYSLLASLYLNTDSCYFFAEKADGIARDLGFKLDEAISKGQMAYALMDMGNYPKSLQTYMSAFKLAEDPNIEKKILPARYRDLEEFYSSDMTAHDMRLWFLSWLHESLGILYENTNNYEKAVEHVQLSKQLAANSRAIIFLLDDLYILGRLYIAMNNLDSALEYEKRYVELARQSGIEKPNTLNLARVYKAMGERALATEYFRSALVSSTEQKYFRGVVASSLELSAICLEEGKPDSGFYFASKGLGVAEQIHMPDLLLRSYRSLAEVYRSTGRNDSAVKYQALIIKLNDSIFNRKQAKLFQNIESVEKQRQQEMDAAQKSYRNRVLTYALVAGLASLLMVALLLLRNNLHKQKAYVLMKRQKKETDIQKAKAEIALEELKSTQLQLIQSEKMASLGQLTAGIAHEIKNPLNFVNNFSELNKELIAEMRGELDAGNTGKALELSMEIESNLEKVINHGQRADDIVNSMLLHSAKSAGEKEATDINAMCSECLWLAFQGFRAKDKTFDATLQTNLDESIGEISIMPQEIGRVLLNVFNNALYAVSEQSRKSAGGYVPTVSVSTRKYEKRIEIRVSDNGTGIPENLVGKIFEPFFTTKPTGKGAGLGLSLSYDIIKAQRGEIKVETKEGEGSEFIILLNNTFKN